MDTLPPDQIAANPGLAAAARLVGPCDLPILAAEGNGDADELVVVFDKDGSPAARAVAATAILSGWPPEARALVSACSAPLRRRLGLLAAPHWGFSMAPRPDGARLKWYFEARKCDETVGAGDITSAPCLDAVRSGGAALSFLEAAGCAGGEAAVAAALDLGFLPELYGLNLDPNGAVEAKVYFAPPPGHAAEALAAVAATDRTAAAWAECVARHVEAGMEGSGFSLAVRPGRTAAPRFTFGLPDGGGLVSPEAAARALGYAGGLDVRLATLGWTCQETTVVLTPDGTVRDKRYFTSGRSIRRRWREGRAWAGRRD